MLWYFEIMILTDPRYQMLHFPALPGLYDMDILQILVTVYINCDELELLLNGESLGRKPIEKYGHGEWDVPYIPGTLEAKGYRAGILVASHVRTTTGRPEALRLTLDNSCTAISDHCDVVQQKVWSEVI